MRLLLALLDCFAASKLAAQCQALQSAGSHSQAIGCFLKFMEDIAILAVFIIVSCLLIFRIILSFGCIFIIFIGLIIGCRVILRVILGIIGVFAGLSNVGLFDKGRVLVGLALLLAFALLGRRSVVAVGLVRISWLLWLVLLVKVSGVDHWRRRTMVRKLNLGSVLDILISQRLRCCHQDHSLGINAKSKSIQQTRSCSLSVIHVARVNTDTLQ